MQKLGKSIIIIMFITMTSRILGFVRELALATIHGATAYTDAYLVAITIPLVIFSSIGVALGTTFIPLYSEIVQYKGKKRGIEFTNNIFNIIILLTVALSILGIAFIKPVVGIFAIGFQGERLSLTIRFTRVLLPGIILIGINSILGAFLQSNKKFKIPEITGIPNNIIIIASIFLSSIWNINILVYGTLVGFLSQVLFQLFFTYKQGYRYSFKLRVDDKSIGRLLYLVTPVLMGTAVQQINTLIDRTIASTLYVGSIAALNFAHKLSSFVYGVFTLPIANVMYPVLSDLVVKEDKRAFKESIRKSINYIFILIIPITIGAMCLDTPIVSFLFERGKFDSRATEMTSIALFYYAIGMIGLGLRNLFSKVFYSLQDTKTPMVNGTIAVALNIALNFILVRFMEHGGLALATSISSLFGTALLFVSLRKKIGDFGERKIFEVAVKTIIASLPMGLGVKLFYSSISSSFNSGILEEGISLFLSILLGGIIYFILLSFLKIEEIDYSINILKSKTQLVFTGIGDHAKVMFSHLQSTGEEQRTIAKRLKLLIGIMSSEMGGAQKIVYSIIASLPQHKYHITLVTTGRGELIEWIDKINTQRENKVEILTISDLSQNRGIYEYIRSSYSLYRIVKSNGFDIVHFFEEEMGFMGRLTAWAAGAPKIFYTIDEWPIIKYKSMLRRRLFGVIERKIGNLCTKVICTSEHCMNMGISKGWINEENTCLIYNGASIYPEVNSSLRRELKINKRDWVLGTIIKFEVPREPSFMITLVKKLIDRGEKVKLVLIGDGLLKEKCVRKVNALGLNRDIFILGKRKDARELLNDFDVFIYFTKGGSYPLSISEAMLSEKPIVSNKSDGIEELVKDGETGYLLDNLEAEEGVKHIQRLLKDRKLRRSMGRKGKELIKNNFSQREMVRKYNSLYTK